MNDHPSDQTIRKTVQIHELDLRQLEHMIKEGYVKCNTSIVRSVIEDLIRQFRK